MVEIIISYVSALKLDGASLPPSRSPPATLLRQFDQQQRQHQSFPHLQTVPLCHLHSTPSLIHTHTHNNFSSLVQHLYVRHNFNNHISCIYISTQLIGIPIPALAVLLQHAGPPPIARATRAANHSVSVRQATIYGTFLGQYDARQQRRIQAE